MDEFSERRINNQLIPVEVYSPNYIYELEDFLNYCIGVFNQTLVDSTGGNVYLRNLVTDVKDLKERL